MPSIKIKVVSQAAPTDRHAEPLRRRLNLLLLRFHAKKGRHKWGTLAYFQIEGDCLRPWLMEGDTIMVSPGAIPSHGDLVLVAMRYRASTVATFLGAGAPSREIVRASVKQLVIRDGRQFLACADGEVNAEGHEIQGVVCGTHRGPLFSLRRWTHPMKSMRFDPPSAPTA